MRYPINVNAFVVCDGEYLMLKRSPGNGGFWQGVSGGVESGESLETAIRREILEETGIKLYRPTLLGSYVRKRKGQHCMELFYVIRSATRLVRLSEEHTEFRWVDYKEAMKLLKYRNNKLMLKKYHNGNL